MSAPALAEFQVGDLVGSNELGMRIYGRVDRLFDLDGASHLDLTRLWPRTPRSVDEREAREQLAGGWYRTASKCRAWVPTAKEIT